MEPFAKETLPISLEEEMRRSYLDYAMSVIVGRALPDVRDGLKPVHRRVLYAMHEANNTWNRPYVKCARIVGDVLGKYHPHGDTATYEALVRMAQDFSMRYTLVDGQGNFGSVDGDAAAAYRYTECRLDRIASEMLPDIDKETVDFTPNYDGKEFEPAVLPTRVPNLLVNGSSGIAVGMATNIPPHNLGEVVDACLHVLAQPHCAIEEVIKLMPAPDFPTAGIIYGLGGVHEGYRTGRGRVVMRARTHFEEVGRGDRQAVIVDELPYQVNKKALLERIAELVTEKKLEGVSDIRDESDRSGMRVVIELKRAEIPEVVLNNLFKQTQLQDTFGINMVALVDGQPRLLSVKELIEAFISHRREVTTRRTVYDLRKARERGHVLEGLAVALSNVDEVIALIKKAATPADAKRELMSRSWRSPLVGEMLHKATPQQFRPEGLPESFGMQDDGYHLSDERARYYWQDGIDPRAAAAAADRPRAGQDPRRVPRGDREHRRPARHPRQAQPHHGDHRRGAEEDKGGIRRCAAQRDRYRRRGHRDRGPDCAAGHGGHLFARRLCQVAAACRLPRPAPRRPRQDGHHDEGGRLHRAPVRRAFARSPAVLLEPRQAVLAQGVRSARRQPLQPRQADRQHVPAGGRREDHRGGAGQGVRREPLRVHGHLAGHGEEDAACRVLAPAAERHHCGRARRGRLPGRGGADRRQVQRDAVLVGWQGGAVPGRRRASDGPPGDRRARHAFGRGLARGVHARGAR